MSPTTTVLENLDQYRQVSPLADAALPKVVNCRHIVRGALRSPTSPITVKVLDQLNTGGYASVNLQEFDSNLPFAYLYIELAIAGTKVQWTAKWQQNGQVLTLGSIRTAQLPSQRWNEINLDKLLTQLIWV